MLSGACKSKMRHNTNVAEPQVNTTCDEENFGQNLPLSPKLHLLADVVALYRPRAGIVGYAKNGHKKVVETSVDHVRDQCEVGHSAR